SFLMVLTRFSTLLSRTPDPVSGIAPSGPPPVWHAPHLAGAVREQSSRTLTKQPCGRRVGLSPTRTSPLSPPRRPPAPRAHPVPSAPRWKGPAARTTPHPSAPADVRSPRAPARSPESPVRR